MLHLCILSLLPVLFCASLALFERHDPRARVTWLALCPVAPVAVTLLSFAGVAVTALSFPLFCLICAGETVFFGAIWFLRLRRKLSTAIFLAALFCLCATILLVFPTQWVEKEEAVHWGRFGYPFLSSVMYALKSLTGETRIDQLESIALDGAAKQVYFGINYALAVLSPVLTSGLLLSFFKEPMEFIRYYLFQWHRRVCVLSCVNDNALSLAEGLLADAKKHHKKISLVFCGVDKQNPAEFQAARDLGAHVFFLPCEKLYVKHLWRKYEFFLIDYKEENNIAAAQELLDLYKNRRHAVTVNAFAESGIHMDLLEHVAAAKEQKPLCHVFPDSTPFWVEEAQRCVEEQKAKHVLFCNTKTPPVIDGAHVYTTRKDANNLCVCGKLKNMNGAFYTRKVSLERVSRDPAETARTCHVFPSDDGAFVQKLTAIVLDCARGLLREENNPVFVLPTDKKEQILSCLRAAARAEGLTLPAFELIPQEKTEEELRAVLGTVNVCFYENTPVRKTRPLARHAKSSGGVRLIFRDELSLFCNNLLYENPLFDLPEGETEARLLIVGAGHLGRQMLRTALWAGQLQDVRLSVRVLDKDATRAKEEFFTLYPELNSPLYDVLFTDADVLKDDLQKKCGNDWRPTYATVATGDDELNLATATRLYEALRRKNAAAPKIFVRVRGKAQSSVFQKDKSFLSDRGIHIVGTADYIYKHIRTLTELEKLGFAVHKSYCGALGLPASSAVIRQARRDFFASEYNRRSSLASALHIPAKLKEAGVSFDVAEGNTRRKRTPGELAAAFEDAIKKDPALLEKLAQTEHLRWNAYMRSEGWRGASFEEVAGYVQKTKSHKEPLCRLHPCLTTWEELDSFETRFNASLASKKDGIPFFDAGVLKKNDRAVVRDIPKILRDLEN